MTELEQRHDSLIRGMPCIVTDLRPSVPHHIDSQRKHHDLLTIPIIFALHQGIAGIHTLGAKKWMSIYGDEYDLLSQTWSEMDPEHIREVKAQLKEDLWKRLQAHGEQRLREVLGCE